jgi:hypothetical protein
MVKFIVLVAVVLIVVFLIKNAGRKADKSAAQRDAKQSAQDEKQQQDAATMVVCAHCAVHLPKVEAVQRTLSAADPAREPASSSTAA